MRLWIGTSGFQYPEWKGNFYPERLPAKQMLPFYAERFATTEINYSFRRIPNPGTIADWAGATPPGFRFSFKAPQKITHFARLKECAPTLKYFFSVIGELNEKLGAVLFQLPPDFEKDLPRLETFLDDLPDGMLAAFEFRHRSWFDDAVFSLLASRRAALCFAESENLAAPDVATADFGYLRLRRADYTEADLEHRADLIASHEDRWRDVFVYFKHEESGTGPAFAKTMNQCLARCAK